MGRDASTGVVQFDGRELRTATDRSLDPELFADLESAMTQIAQGYHPRRIVWSVPPQSARLVTVHPFGGAAIADGPEEGVVDHTGQVFGNPGPYLADGSLLPTRSRPASGDDDRRPSRTPRRPDRRTCGRYGPRTTGSVS